MQPKTEYSVSVSCEIRLFHIVLEIDFTTFAAFGFMLHKYILTFEFVIKHFYDAASILLASENVCMYGVSRRYDGSRPQSVACVRLWLCRPIRDAQSRPQT